MILRCLSFIFVIPLGEGMIRFTVYIYDCIYIILCHIYDLLIVMLEPGE